MSAADLLSENTEDTDFDENGVRIRLKGSLWRLRKGIFGGHVWKRRWCESDGVYLRVWGGDEKHKDKGTEKHKFILSHCRVEGNLNDIRKNAFRIVDHTQKKGFEGLVLATDTREQYETWFDFIDFDKDYSDMLAKVEDAKAKKSEDAETLRQLREEEEAARDDRTKEQVIADFFSENDISSTLFAVIHKEQAIDLLTQLEPTGDIVHSNALKFIQGLGVDSKSNDNTSNRISYESFKRYWEAYKMKYTLRRHQHFHPLDNIESCFGYDDDSLDSILFSGIVDPDLVNEQLGVTVRNLLKTYIPRLPEAYVTLNPHTFDDDEYDELGGVEDAAIGESKERNNFDVVNASSSINYKWDSVYQHLVEGLSTTFMLELANQHIGDETQSLPPSNTGRRMSSKELWAYTSNEKALDYVKLGFEVASVQGDFLAHAATGARTVIDEYPLPDNVKSVKRISKTLLMNMLREMGVYHEEEFQEEEKEESIQYSESTPHASLIGGGKVVSYSLADYHRKRMMRDDPNNSDDGSDGLGGSDSSSEGATTVTSIQETANFEMDTAITDSSNEDMFVYKGILISICACRVDEDEDLQPSEKRARELSALDELLHKIAGNEHRGLVCMKHVIDKVTRDQIRTMWESHDEDNDAPPFFGNLTRAHTLLSTVIDYGGYRLQAFCPVALDSKSTLVFGESYMNSKRQEVFVNAHAPLAGYLPKLAQYMNLNLTKTLRMTSNKKLNEKEGTVEGEKKNSNSGVFKKVVETFAPGMEVHQSAEGRLYVINLTNVLVSELPRANTYDLETRKLRPEFQLKYKKRLSSNAYARISKNKGVELSAHRSDFGDNMSDLSDGMSRVGGDDDRMETSTVMGNSSGNLTDILSANTFLYTQLLPNLAKALDTLICVPYDSYSISSYLHAYGASMRHLGVLYGLCKNQVVRKTILCEAVARCCKCIVNKLCKETMRKGKAVSMKAEYRGRSGQKEYNEQAAAVTRERNDMILNLFNLTLGHSRETFDFWNKTIPDILFQKFSLDISSWSGSGIGKSVLAARSKYELHLPQLFLAMQYHIGIVFKDSCAYQFAHSDKEECLSHEDVLIYTSPRTKPLCFTGSKVIGAGYIGIIDQLADTYLATNMPAEAANAYRIRLSLQLTSYNQICSYRDSFAISSSVYKLALALYKIGNYDACISFILESGLQNRPRYTALTGRFLTLLMCAQFSNGMVGEAIETYDAGMIVYNYVLGHSHSLQILHSCALADLYFKSRNFRHCLVMMLTSNDMCMSIMGESHILTATYLYKTACVYFTLAIDNDDNDEQNLECCLEVLQEAYHTFKECAEVGANVNTELIECLHLMTMACKWLHRSDVSLEYAMKVGQMVMKKKKKKKLVGFVDGSDEQPKLTAHAVSCLFLLADLLLYHNRSEEGLKVLETVWRSVQETFVSWRSISGIYTKLTCKMLFALYSSLPYPTRSLVESIAMEIETGTEPLYGIEIPGMWSKACNALFEGMWRNEPKKYFKEIIDGVLAGEIDFHQEKNYVDTSNLDGVKDVRIGVDASKLNGLQVAVIMRCIRGNPGEADAKKKKDAKEQKKNPQKVISRVRK
jgi:hypothetical protein